MICTMWHKQELAMIVRDRQGLVSMPGFFFFFLVKTVIRIGDTGCGFDRP